MLLGCGRLLAMGAAFAPRLVLAFMWIVGPRVNAAFNTFSYRCSASSFCPTRRSCTSWSGVPGLAVAGWDWVWVLLGVAA